MRLKPASRPVPDANACSCRPAGSPCILRSAFCSHRGPHPHVTARGRHRLLRRPGGGSSTGQRSHLDPRWEHPRGCRSRRHVVDHRCGLDGQYLRASRPRGRTQRALCAAQHSAHRGCRACDSNPMLDGHPVGAFGAVSVFSLSKHLPGRGGIISLGDEVSRREVVKLKAELMAPKPRPAELWISPGQQLGTLRKPSTYGRLRNALAAHSNRSGPSTWRVPLRARLRAAVSGIGLDQFDQWMGTGYRDYRMPQQPRHLKRTLAALRDLDRDRDDRIAGCCASERLMRLPPQCARGPRNPCSECRFWSKTETPSPSSCVVPGSMSTSSMPPRSTTTPGRSSRSRLRRRKRPDGGLRTFFLSTHMMRTGFSTCSARTRSD